MAEGLDGTPDPRNASATQLLTPGPWLGVSRLQHDYRWVLVRDLLAVRFVRAGLAGGNPAATPVAS
jgi:hypothetical protein